MQVDLECEHCVLQWKYVTGNIHGICDDGTRALGCGPQEEFRACSDIAIGLGSVATTPTQKPVKIRPRARKPPTEAPNENENKIDNDYDEITPPSRRRVESKSTNKNKSRGESNFRKKQRFVVKRKILRSKKEDADETL